MRITENTFRTILQTRKLSFSKDLNFSTTSGAHYFGFSGDSDSVDFKFENGKIYDPEDRLVYTYNELNSFNLSGTIETGSYSYYINGLPICTNGSKNNFLINKFYYEVSDGLNLDADNFYIKTDANSTDSLSLLISDTTFFPSGSVTGLFRNQSPGNLEAINKVFTGSVSADSYFEFASSFPFNTHHNSGEFVLNNIAYDLDNYKVDLTFTTATGDVTVTTSLNKKNPDISPLETKTRSGVGTVTNIVDNVEEVLTLTSLYEQEGDFTIQEGQVKNIDFSISYNRYSGSAKTDVSKTLSVRWYVTNYDYITSEINATDDINANFDFFTGTSVFTYVKTLLSEEPDGFPLTSTTLDANENKFLMQIDHIRFADVTPNIYYEIVGETTKITGLVSGL
jgi:hypothetical protein